MNQHEDKDHPIIMQDSIGWYNLRIRLVNKDPRTYSVEVKKYLLPWREYFQSEDEFKVISLYSCLTVKLREKIVRSNSICKDCKYYLDEEGLIGIRCAVNPHLVNKGCDEYSKI